MAAPVSAGVLRLTLDRCESIGPAGSEVLVKVRVVGDGPSSVRPWQQSQAVAGPSPAFKLEAFDIDITDISVDKLQLVVWDVSNGQDAPNGPGEKNHNFLGEVLDWGEGGRKSLNSPCL
jgi:hypothetical protein